MIKQLPLYFKKNENRYYYVGLCSCDSCNVILDKIVIIKHIWNKKNSDVKLFCLNCFNKEKASPGIIEELIGAKIVLERPENSYPIIIQPPTVTNSKNNETVFTMAEHSAEGEEVIDNTRFAGRESLDGTEQIGLSPDLVDEPKKVLDNDEARNLLLSHKTAKAVKPEPKQDLIDLEGV